jgi:uncharacterized protein (DUF952 family)
VTTVYKICTGEEWKTAVAQGVFHGSPDDRRDGFIHFSTTRQLRETARRHFAGIDHLVLVAVEAEALGSGLKWEKSRGGDLFPHLYAALDVAKAHTVLPLPWNGSAHDFPPEISK